MWEFICLCVMIQGCPLPCHSLHLACTWMLAETEPHRASTNMPCVTSPLTNSGSPPGPPSAQSRCVSPAPLQNSKKKDAIVRDLALSSAKANLTNHWSSYESRFHLRVKKYLQTVTLFLATATLFFLILYWTIWLYTTQYNFNFANYDFISSNCAYILKCDFIANNCVNCFSQLRLYIL